MGDLVCSKDSKAINLVTLECALVHIQHWKQAVLARCKDRDLRIVSSRQKAHIIIIVQHNITDWTLYVAAVI